MVLMRSLLVLLLIVMKLKICEATGTLEISLQSYRFDYGAGNSKGSGSDPNSSKTPLVALDDYVKTYQPEWQLGGVFNLQDQGLEAKNRTASSLLNWPWLDPTTCQAPPRYRFLLCLDYADNFDPSRPCRLERIQTELIPATRVPFRPQFGRYVISFDNVLGMTLSNDVIPNPLEIHFDEWKGPINLAVFVRCCGGVSMLEEQCEEILSTTITTWPRPVRKGKQTLRYSMEGRGSLTFGLNANCDEHYYGRSCNIHCKVDNPALEHAFCNASTGTKQCLQGWQGLDCQTDTDECRAIVCRNGGTCINSQGTYTCQCPFSTRGRRCERRYPVCHLQPCQHQGTCLETPSGSLCLCMPGFEGPWCNLLEGQEQGGAGSGRLLDSRDHVGGRGPTTLMMPIPRPNGTEEEEGYTNVKGNEESQKKDEQFEESSAWHHWYLGIIAALVLLVCLILIVIFLAYRSKIRKQYMVNLPIEPPTAAASKPRVFGNAVYQKEDPSSVIQPNSFNIFYESKNLNSIIPNKSLNTSAMNNNNNNNNNNNSNGSTVLQKTNNVEISPAEEPSELDAKALMRKPSCFDRPSNDHAIEFDDRISLTEPRRSQNQDHPVMRSKDVTTLIGSEEPKRTASGYEMATLRRSMDFSNDDSGGYRNPRTLFSQQPVYHYEPLNATRLSQNMSANGKTGSDFPKYPYPCSFHAMDWSQSSSEAGFRPEIKGKRPTTQRQGTNLSRAHEHLFGNNTANEHEYEDINPDYRFKPIPPVPKPRQFVRQAQQDTMQIRTKSFDDIIHHDSFRRQLYHRQCSDGLLDNKSKRQPISAYVDRSLDTPMDNVLHQKKGKPENENRRETNDVHHPSVKQGTGNNEISQIAGSKMPSRRSENVKDGGDRKGTPTAPVYPAKRRRSGVQQVSGRFSSRRHSKNQIYRNTDIAGFDRDYSPNSPKLDANRYKSDADYFSSRDIAAVTSSPKFGGERRSSTAGMTEKLFGKKRVRDLRRDSETSIDVSIWRGDDDVFDARTGNASLHGYQNDAKQHSSSFV